MEKKKDVKEVYERPDIKSEEIFERTALSCWYAGIEITDDTKDSSYSCDIQES